MTRILRGRIVRCRATAGVKNGCAAENCTLDASTLHELPEGAAWPPAAQAIVDAAGSSLAARTASEGRTRAPSPAHNRCVLGCSVSAIGVYWGCALKCVHDVAPNSCITEKCPAAVTAFDVGCLEVCNKNNTASEYSGVYII